MEAEETLRNRVATSERQLGEMSGKYRSMEDRVAQLEDMLALYVGYETPAYQNRTMELKTDKPPKEDTTVNYTQWR